MTTPDTIPGKLNLALSAGIAAAMLVQLLILPHSSHPVLMAAVVLLLVPLNTPFWSLIHEAIHRNFHTDKTVNEYGGRLLSILFGASFGVLRFGHLMHHQYNREWESEYYDEAEKSKLLACANHYFMMLGGLYYVEVLMSLLIALLPRKATEKIARMIFTNDQHYQAVLNALLKPDNARKIRMDFGLVVVFYGLVFMLAGAHWFLPLLLLAGRGFIISFMDNSYHYGTPPDNSVPAKELRTPALLSKFVLRFNYHLTHHNNTRLPWTALPKGHADQGNAYSEGLGAALLAQFKGPIRTDNANLAKNAESP